MTAPAPGLLDLPSGVLGAVDIALLKVLPAALLPAFWGLVAAVLCLELYRWLSPQRAVSTVKGAARQARRDLGQFDGEFEDAWPLLVNSLRLSSKRVAIVLPATLVAALPVLILYAHLNAHYSYRMPDMNEPVQVVAAAPMRAHWQRRVAMSPQITVTDADNKIRLSLALHGLNESLYKRQWWNFLLANPAGYLPVRAPIDELHIDLPRRQLLHWGPDWLRGWEAVFIGALFPFALFYKTWRSIH